MERKEETLRVRVKKRRNSKPVRAVGRVKRNKAPPGTELNVSVQITWMAQSMVSSNIVFCWSMYMALMRATTMSTFPVDFFLFT